MKNNFANDTPSVLEPRFPWGVVSLIVLAGAAARAWLLFRTPLVPGMNGAYYLVQARSVIEQGRLGIPDLPLTFFIQAMLAKIVQIISGASLQSSIVFAVKCADAFLPPLVAIPVFALTRQWAQRVGAGVWVPACAAIAVAIGAPALMMVGDFQKNSLGLVWMASLLWSLHNWFAQPTIKRALLSVLFLGLIGLTHIGVFGWSLALTVLVMGAALVRSEPKTRWAILPWLFVGGAVCALAAGLVLWKFDPARVQRLTSAMAHPFTYLHQSQARTGNLPPSDFRSMRGQANFPGGPGMMPGGWNWLPTAALLGASAAALLAAWLRRKSLPAGSVAVVAGCALGLLVLSGPWVTGDKVMRFRLIAVGPALLCASFALLQLRLPRLRAVAAAILCLALVVPGAIRVVRGGRPVITLDAAKELQSLSGEISSPAKTLVVARHGLEWWAAWYLHTHIAHANALTEADWKKFDAVYFLLQKGGMQVPFGPGARPDRLPTANGQSFHEPWNIEHRTSNTEHQTNSRPDGPPDFAGGFPPPDQFGGRPFPPRGPGGPGGMGEPRIPRDADITHDGEFFTLALVPVPEGFPSARNGELAMRPPPFEQ